MNTNTARKLDVVSVGQKSRKYEVLPGNKNYKLIKTLDMVRSGIFLTIAAVVLMGVITYYLTLQSDITNSIKSISKAESTLNQLKLDNDENYSRITSNVNLEEVRTIAIQELGMRYAEEGQIISFNGEGSDYVRQTGSIPD